jgi:hypothetical protein
MVWSLQAPRDEILTSSRIGIGRDDRAIDSMGTRTGRDRKIIIVYLIQEKAV